jgi:hypothetical protein
LIIYNVELENEEGSSARGNRSGDGNLGRMNPSNTRMPEEADDRTEWARVFGAEAQVISIDTPLNGLVMKAIYTDESAFSTVL